MKCFKVLVCGGRDYRDQDTVNGILDFYNPDVVIHGHATGADTCAANWAWKHGKAQRAYPARWDKFGNRAGPIRNYEMITKEKDELNFVIAFPGGKGTENMINLAKTHLKPEQLIIVGEK